MELDQWKEIWQAETPAEQTDSQKLRALLDRKSGSPVSKIKRNLNAELWVVLVTYGAMVIFYFFAFDGRMNEISWFMLVIAGLFVAYYLRKQKLLREMEYLNRQVKNNLEKQVESLERYIRFYLVSGTALVPFSMVFFGWLLQRKGRLSASDTIFFASEQNPLWRAILAWVVLTSLTTLIMYYINKWYVRKLYGRHVEKLRAILDEMKGDD
jgi:4-hydroxybenzoate polyprenyltransferase